jgi:hypothetical protein
VNLRFIRLKYTKSVLRLSEMGAAHSMFRLASGHSRQLVCMAHSESGRYVTQKTVTDFLAFAQIDIER